MIVRYLDDKTPRSDGKKGKPTCMTVGVLYQVVEENETQYRVINDKGKRSRYSKIRFVEQLELDFTPESV